MQQHQALITFIISFGPIPLDQEKNQSMKSGSFQSFKLDLKISCPSLNICRYFQIEIMSPPKYESHHRSSCLSNFCWEVAQTWIILDPVFSFIRKKRYDSIKTFPEKLNYCISVTISYFCYFLNELIKIQGNPKFYFPQYCSPVFTIWFVSYLIWKISLAWTPIMVFECWK